MAMFNGWTMLKLPEGSLSWSNVALGKFVVGVPVASCQFDFCRSWEFSCRLAAIMQFWIAWICWICPRWVWFFCWFIHHLLYVSSSLMAFSKSTRTSPVVFHSGELWRCVEVTYSGKDACMPETCWMLQWEWRRLQIPPCEDSTWQDCLELR